MSKPTAALSWVLRWREPDGTSALRLVSESQLYGATVALKRADARDIRWERAPSFPPTSTGSGAPEGEI